MIYLNLFWIFFKLGLISIGGVFGVMPELERWLATDFGISREEFIQGYVISQFVPGPNMAMCALFGYKVAGFGGAVAGFLGVYTPPLLIMGFTFLIYHRLRENSHVRRIEISLRPLMVGLLASAVVRFWWYQISRQAALAVVATVIFCFLYYKKKLSALQVTFSMGGVWFLWSNFIGG